MIKIIIIILILGASLVYPNYRDLRKFNQEITEINDNIIELEKANENLRSRIKDLREELFYIEKVARETLGLVRPGEIIYRITFYRNHKKTARGGAVW